MCFAAEGATVRASGNELGVTHRSSSSGVTYTGIGTSTDIIVASARAYVAAINRAIAHEETPTGSQQLESQAR